MLTTRTQNSTKIQWHEAKLTIKIYQCGGNDDNDKARKKSGKLLFLYTHFLIIKDLLSAMRVQAIN